MVKTFLISSAIIFGSMWLLVRYLMRRPEFLSRPEEERRKVRKQLTWGIYGAIALSALFIYAIESKSTRWMPWAMLGLYFLLWVFGTYLILSAYRIGILRDARRMKKLNGRPYNNPQQFMNAVALSDLVFGLAVLAIAVSIPLFRIGLSQWIPILTIIGGARQLLGAKHAKADDA
jgi:hypothetical protein